MHEVFKFFGIKKTSSTPYYPQGDGVVERSIRTIKPLLSIICEENDIQWAEAIPIVELAWRSTKNSTGFSPNEMIFGKSFRDAFDCFANKWEYNTCPIPLHILQSNRELAAKHVRQQFPVIKSNTLTHTFCVGDNVLVKALKNSFGQPKYSGPFTVTRIIGNNAYEVRRGREIQERNGRFLKYYRNDPTNTQRVKRIIKSPNRYGFSVDGGK